MADDEQSGNAAADEAAPSVVELPDSGATDALGPLAYSVSIPLLGHTSDSGPDPEKVKRRAELAEQRKTGKWQAWFVELPGPPDPIAEALGIAKPTRRRFCRQHYLSWCPHSNASAAQVRAGRLSPNPCRLFDLSQRPAQFIWPSMKWPSCQA